MKEKNSTPMVETKEKEGRSKWFIIILAICFFLVFVFLLVRCNGDTTYAKELDNTSSRPVTSGTLLDGSASSMSQEEIEAALDALQRASNFTTYVGGGGSVDAGGTTLHLLVGNLEENTATCTFDLIVDEETLYYSPELIPGKRIEEITLSHALAPGSYDAVVRHNLTYPNGNTATVDVETKITCK